MSFALEFFSVNHSYSRRDGFFSLRDISFSVSQGEVFGFVGPNGAGKTTIIKSMLGLINNYHGLINIYGVDAKLARSRENLAFVPESLALYDRFTPLEALRMALAIYGVKRSSPDSWCLSVLDRFSVLPYATRKIRELSKGNAQRVALAHAMVVQPKLLVLDEPLSGLDPVGRKDVVDILNEYKKQGGAIFFTSHVLHDVERIADRFGFINKGELLTVRSPRELAAERADCLLVRFNAQAGFEPAAKCLRDGEFEFEVMQADLPAFITRLNMAGGHVLTVKPAVSLETVFFKILEDAERQKMQVAV